MTSHSTQGGVPPGSDKDPYGRWPYPSMEPNAAESGASDPAAAPFDPYRFGAPEHPVPPEYAPPGYTPPAPPGYKPSPPQHQHYYSPPPQHGYPQPGPGNGKAIAALVLGILSIVFCVASFLDLFLIIPAIVFGSLALNDAKRSNGSGRGMAITGFVCAVVGAVLAITITVWLYPKVANCANDYEAGSSQYNTCIRNIVR